MSALPAHRSAPLAARFEQRWRGDADPWGYATSGYERDKYAATLAACGNAPLGRVLELGGANGVFSALLADRSRRLETLDCSPTAVALARERVGPREHVALRVGTVPEDLPVAAPFDLVVASEILYYLDDAAFARTLDRLPSLLAPDGRLVAVHWTGDAPDLARSASATHRALAAHPGLRPLPAASPDDAGRGYLLDVLTAR